jgi:hypothetical protein
MKQCVLVYLILVVMAGCELSEDSSSDTSTSDTSTDITQPFERLGSVETDLLSLINEERVGAGLPELLRDSGMDQIMLYYGTEMATDHHIGHIDRENRDSEARSRFYSKDKTIRCLEITQWWGGTPSGSVHYTGYRNSPSHRSGYLEEGLFNLGPTTHAGVVALEGTGPTGSQFEGRDGSYTGVMLCDMPLILNMDPFTNESN